MWRPIPSIDGQWYTVEGERGTYRYVYYRGEPDVLRYSQQAITEDDERAVLRVLRSPWLTQGPEVEAFEREVAEFVRARYAVAVSSGTGALEMLARLMDRDALVSPLSFVATALAFEDNEVSFGDVDRITGNLAPAGLPACGWSDILVPVHYGGRSADVRALRERNPRARIIEDACHAFGAVSRTGRPVGSCEFSDAAVFSFHPVKPLTTAEGGMITTNHEDLARDLRAVRCHGRDSAGLCQRRGGNYRMSELQAALGRSQLRRCLARRVRRFALAQEYISRLEGVVDLSWAKDGSEDDAWHLMLIRTERRDGLREYLNAHGIGAQVHYSPPIHLQPYYRRQGWREGDCPEAEAWSRECLSLPLYAEMVTAQVEQVCERVRAYLC